MHSVFVWSRQPGWLSPDVYSEVHRWLDVVPVCLEESPPPEPGLVLVDEDILRERRADVEVLRNACRTAVLVIAVSSSPEKLGDDDLLFDVVTPRPRDAELARRLRNASSFLSARLELEVSRAAAKRKAQELEDLHSISIALSAERDHERLLNLILSKAREVTSADAGSLFLVSSLDMPIVLADGSVDRVGGRWLRFRLAQNDSRRLSFDEDILPISPRSIAGYVAQTGETLNLENAYDPPADKPFAINRTFDEATGYRTRSMLVVPMQNHEGDNIGVLQLINKKTSRDIVLKDPPSFDEHVLRFDENDERLVRSLASQAAVSVENNHLYRERENLFGRFVQAAVKAIESRDPTTEGHSQRVADMTEELAKVTSRAETGPYRDLRLSVEQVRELRYASLLHDFGKVGVKEKILRKAQKLYHGELSAVRQRFKTIRRTVEADYLRRMLDGLLRRGGSSEEIERLKRELSERLAVVEEALGVVEQANRPTVMEESAFERLKELAGLTYVDVDGSPRGYLEPEELDALTISRGSLTHEERLAIQHHVNHTFDFLSNIPWTRDLQEIPNLARSHHEKLDGSGYPAQLGADDIPPQTRMMTISDIYDALTARDRPYKPAVPTERALGILEQEATDGMLDADLLKLFIEAKVFEQGIVN